MQLIEAARVPIAALVRRGLFASLGGLQVCSTDSGRTCRWDAQWPRGVRRISGESRALAIGRPVLTIVQSHRVGKHLADFPFPEPARIRIFDPVEHSRVEHQKMRDYLPSPPHEGIGLCQISPSSGFGHTEFRTRTSRPEDVKRGLLSVVPGSDITTHGGAMFATEIQGDNFPARISKGLMKRASA